MAALDPPLFQSLEVQLRPEQPPLSRLAAATALGKSAPADAAQRPRMTKAIAAAGALELSPLLAAYERLGNPEVGRKLIAALAAAPGLPAPFRGPAARFPGLPAANRAGSGTTVKHLEVDAGKQRARLVELEGVLSGGKAARGRKVFFGNRAACSTCHAVQKEGGHVGPD